jgi:hypothetical protein
MVDIVKNTTQNDTTGDRLVSKPSNKKYDEGWERIFGKGVKKKGKDK